MFQKQELLYSQVTINIHKTPKPIQRFRNISSCFYLTSFLPTCLMIPINKLSNSGAMPSHYLCQELTPLKSPPLFLSHIHLQPTPPQPAAQTSGHLHWKLPLIQPNSHSSMPSYAPALISKCNICLSVLTSNLIIDFKESIKKSFLHFILS